jgi:hypothetical protein
MSENLDSGSPAEKYEYHQMVYLGYRYDLINDKKEVEFRYLEGDKSSISFNPGKNFKSLQAGSVYRVPRMKDGSGWLIGKAAYVGMHQDHDERIGIVMASRAAETASKTKKRAEAISKGEDLDMLLLPLRKAYSNIFSSTEQMAFELLVIRSLRKRPKV